MVDVKVAQNVSIIVQKIQQKSSNILHKLKNFKPVFLDTGRTLQKLLHCRSNYD